MSTTTAFYVTYALAAAFCFEGICGGTSCDSPQFLELGKSGSINCSFPDNFHGVLWYNTTELVFNDPLVDYRNSIKKGIGYTSGEFDVYSNGSLIINRVTLEHEHTFRVAYLHSIDVEPVLIDVAVSVVVKPSVPFPVFTNCGNSSNVCFAPLPAPSMQCSVVSGRPAIPLKVFARTLTGDISISVDETSAIEGDGFTTSVDVTTKTLEFSPLLLLLVCKASALPGILQNDESYLLAQKGAINISSKDLTVKYIEHNSRMELKCTDTDAGFLVWKKADSVEDKNPEVLLYSINISNHVTKIFVDDVFMEGNTSLILSKTRVQHSGYYFCLFGDGVADFVNVYEVIVFVNPIPGYPVIDGCNHQQYCVLEVEREGTLTCKVTGIRPQIQLQWEAFYDSDADSISFTNQQLMVKDNGETFDVSLTATYYVTDTSRERITIECKGVGELRNTFHLTTKVDLIFIDFNPMEDDPPATTSNLNLLFPVTGVAIFLLIVVGIITGKYILKNKGQDSGTTSEGNEEVTKMLRRKTYDAKTNVDLKDVFVKQVKEKYKDWYDAVQPIPYIKDRLYCVDKIFVEGGIEFLDSVKGKGRRGVWTTLETYENIFNASQVSSLRRLLEGEPGYGKSTVTLQFAYDWCNPKPTSALKDAEILILLRLRQLGGVPSIYKAIKRFILPRDTTISETDIEQILRNSKSVVVILDGFDEYPDQDSTTITDVMTIIARQMFQNFEVVTTTRSSFLPKKYPPLTKRIRLTGFDDKARRYYIRKAVVGDDDEGVRNIEGYLEDNPILSDLCQVPLLFVIFAHMTYESEQFRKLNSVTSFFRHMISCFHSHMRNKMDEENVRKYELFETDHGDLDKLAFKAFSGQSQRIIWDKDEMRQLLGQEFYDQYIRIGILVEEESVDIIDDPGTPITVHVQYKKEVRFYHKLFCEWYAAHYLTDYLQRNPTLDLDEFLRHLDPFDVQYLYRFACGINSYSAERIIDYLKNIEGGDKFAILCILEQTGKIDKIKETIRHLCDEGVVISGHDTLLLQRSSMQLLEIAARNEIPVEGLFLENCLQSVELAAPSIRTTSGMVLTSKIPVKALEIGLYSRDMTKDEAIDILQFASKCPSLEELRFGGSVPLQSFNVDSTLNTLKSRNVTVKWWMFKDHPVYILNLKTGRWEREDNNEELTSANFGKMRLEFAKHMTTQSDETFQKGQTKRMREMLRKNSEERRKNNPA